LSLQFLDQIKSRQKNHEKKPYFYLDIIEILVERVTGAAVQGLCLVLIPLPVLLGLKFIIF
jgi:hypothetical protein